MGECGMNMFSWEEIIGEWKGIIRIINVSIYQEKQRMYRC